ncbi:hypothetical protein F2Q68_00012449 [Brassica cretica]|uniref:Uncharacterized protein n=1 Tax=Brassica cretica TaxID=69181 RepID=A0A8S9KS37_BRACR|nr:hypothetical protein F2Q68_00012449 [Brassica cretica]
MKRRNVNEDQPESSLISSKKGMQESSVIGVYVRVCVCVFKACDLVTVVCCHLDSLPLLCIVSRLVRVVDYGSCAFYLKKLPRYSMTHLKTTSSINQKTKDVSVDGQTHQTLISSLDQIFHGSTSPKCKSRNGSVDSCFVTKKDDRIEKHEKREVKSPERVERESRSKIGSGERPARERACRRRSPSSNCKNVGLSLLFRLLCHPACLSSGSGLICGGSASGLKARLLQLRRRRPLSPGGGSFFSSAVIGFVSGSEGSLSLASPALDVSVRWIGFGSRLWLVCGSGFVVHGFVQSVTTDFTHQSMLPNIVTYVCLCQGLRGPVGKPSLK